MPVLPYSVQPLDLSQSPTTGDLIAAGQRAGQLFPSDAGLSSGPSSAKEGEQQVVARFTRSGTDTPATIVSGENDAVMQREFGRAVQAWNEGDANTATDRFHQFLDRYPASPWRSEALLHLGEDAQGRGRYRDAADYFQQVLELNAGTQTFGETMLLNKARSRLAVLQTRRNRIEEARELFQVLKEEGLFWRERTFAATWLFQLSHDKAREVALMNCGVLALAELLRADGRPETARRVQTMLPGEPEGYSMHALAELASQFDYRLTGRQVALADLAQLPLPAILHAPAAQPKQSGHYWVLTDVQDNQFLLVDPQSGRRVRRTFETFNRSSDTQKTLPGFESLAGLPDTTLDLLVFNESSNQDDTPLPGTLLAQAEMEQIFGGYPPPGYGNGGGRGNPSRNRGGGGGKRGPGSNPNPGLGSGSGSNNRPTCGLGAPDWAVDMVSLNLYMTDTPLWYGPPVGPSVALQLSYNSQSSSNYDEPFGNKWLLFYHSYLLEQTDGSVTIVMPDGREDRFTPDGLGGWLPPYLVHNTLVKQGTRHYELRFPDDTVFVYAVPDGTNSQQPLLTAIRDAHNQAMTLGYDTNARLVSITDAVEQTSTLHYNTDGLVERVDDPFGRSAHFEYDEFRNLTKITDMGGYWTSLSYDADAYLTALENPRGRWEFLTEPTDGQYIGSTTYPAPGDPMGDNYRITVTNPLGGKEEYYYHSQRWQSWYVSPRDYIDYTSGGNEANSVPKTVYDFLETTSSGPGEIRKISFPEGESLTYGYDPDGNRSSITDALGRTTGATYNDLGRMTSITDPKGSTTTLGYASNGVDLETISNDLGTIGLSYNDRHDVTAVTDRLGQTTTFAYNAEGQLTSQTDPLGRVTEFDYESNRHLRAVSLDGTILTELVSDEIGRVLSVTDASGLTLNYQYDDLNHVTEVRYPDGKSEQYSYSGCCPFLIDSSTDRAGRTTFFEHDALERLVSVTNAENGVTSYEYDANWNLSAFTDPEHQTTSFAYDLSNRLIRKTYADGHSTSWQYDRAGQVEQYTNARGTAISYSYDTNGNLNGISYGDGTPSVGYGYDAADRLTSMHDGIGGWSFGYDANSQLTSADGPWESDTLTYQYDVLGRQTMMTPELGTPLTYVYDSLSRLTQIQLGAPDTSYSYSYEGISPLVQNLTRPNGSITAYEYNTIHQLTSILNQTSSGGLLSQHSYSYNRQDLRSSETLDGPAIPELPAFTDHETTYTYNAVNQTVSTNAPDRNFEYDADGNLTKGYTKDGFVFTASYDAENRMTSLEYI